MLEEYRTDRGVWEQNPDTPQLRSDILGTERVIALLGDISGLNILDLGCGNGKVCRRLARLGAKVTGIELVPEQLAFAEEIEQREPLGIRYLQGNLLDCNSLVHEKFDLVLCLMTHLYLDASEFRLSFVAAAACLKEGGRLIYLNIHPSRGACLVTTKHSAVLPTVSGEVFTTTYYQHPLGMVFESLMKAGLQIRNIIEPVPTKDERAQYSELLAGSEQEPTYLIIDAIKPHTPL